VTVVKLKVVADGVFQFACAAMDGAAQLFFGETCDQRSTRLSQEAPVSVEVQMEARMTQQPTLDGRGFVVA